MCTALNYKTKSHYFGRNLDLEYNYNECVCIAPRAFALPFRKQPTLFKHHAIIGMATIQNGYPLYYDATNEKGLSIAALNFPESARYTQTTDNALAPFELIPFLLGRFDSVEACKPFLKNLSIADLPFSDDFPNTPLHWILSDKRQSLTLEPCHEGLVVSENPVHCLTNEPPFGFQMTHLRSFMHLSPRPQQNHLSSALPSKSFSNGMGAMGLPGDASSASRFVRAVFTAQNSVCNGEESESISQVFHILDSVAQVRGTVRLGEAYEKTLYSSCTNTKTGTYYYTTYENRRITAIRMRQTDLDANTLTTFPLRTAQDICFEN